MLNARGSHASRTVLRGRGAGQFLGPTELHYLWGKADATWTMSPADVTKEARNETGHVYSIDYLAATPVITRSRRISRTERR